MKKQKTRITTAVLLLALATITTAGCGCAEKTTAPAANEQPPAENLTVSNELFSITLPKESAGLYAAETTENGIAIFDGKAKDAGYGGFAFAVAAYQEPAEYAGAMDLKVGEFTAADGTLYDIVMQYPTDVQFDYTKYQETIPENYARLYNGAEDIVKTLTGADGSGSFVWGAGTKGEDLYGEMLQKILTAVREDWDANQLESADMGSMYAAMRQVGDGNVLENTGYAYYDVNLDGIDELLLGPIEEDEMKGSVYDIYTIVDRAPAHVASGWTRTRYYALENGMLCNDVLTGVLKQSWLTYFLEPNSTNLIGQVWFKIDGYENRNQPWFVSYNEGETWENLSEEDFEERRARFADYVSLDFTPLAALQGD